MAEGWVTYSPFQDPYSYKSAQAIGTINPGDMTHQVKGYVTYALPFGHGRKWLSRCNSSPPPDHYHHVSLLPRPERGSC
jgi:hypothetical protein